MFLNFACPISESFILGTCTFLWTLKSAANLHEPAFWTLQESAPDERLGLEGKIHCSRTCDRY